MENHCTDAVRRFLLFYPIKRARHKHTKDDKDQEACKDSVEHKVIVRPRHFRSINQLKYQAQYQ